MLTTPGYFRFMFFPEVPIQELTLLVCESPAAAGTRLGYPGTNPMRLLLVEDNELNRDMLGRRLARRGFEMLFAVDGAEGVRMADQAQPDVILMDISLPVMDGWEATTRLKSSPRTAAIPIIALTAHALREDEDHAFAVGCSDFVRKPIELEILLAAIRRLGPPESGP
jgi:CheY-like chemotaxis protein